MLAASCATGRAIRSAQTAAKHGDWDTAVAYYRQALTGDPGRIDVRVALTHASREAADQHLRRARDLETQEQLAGAAAEYRMAADLDPSYTLSLTKAIEIERKIRSQIEASRPKPSIDLLRQQAAQSSAVPRLDPRSKVPLVNFRGVAIRDILQSIGDLTGISVTYDQSSLNAVAVGYTVTLSDVPLEEALNQILTANQLTYKVTNARTIFVYQDNATNRGKYEDQYYQVFYLSHVDAQDMLQILNQMLQSGPVVRPAFQPNKSSNALTVKATMPVLQVIEGIIRANDKPRAEVMIDVEILEVDRTRTKNLGLDLSQWALGFTFSPELSPRNVASAAGAFPEQPPPFNLNTLSQGVSAADFYMTAPTAMIKLLESDVKTKLLARPQLRGRENSPLTLSLGDSIPVPQTTFQSAAAGGLANLPTTSYQYRNIGVNLTITPRVTYQDEIILDPLTVDKSGLGPNITVAGQSLPSFVQRTATVSMRLRDGESNILAGLLKEEDRKTYNSLPGLSHVPFLRSIFGNSDTSLDQSDIVMIVTPHIVRSHELTADDLRPVFIGSVSNFGAAGPPPLISPDAPPPPQMITAPPAGGQPAGPPPAAGAPAGTTGAAQPPAPLTSAAPPPPPAGNPRAVGVVPIEPVASAPAQPNQPALPVQITVTPPGAELQAGGPPYTVPISIAAGASQVGTVTLSLTYNPAVLRATAVTQGTFMQQGGATTSWAPRIDAAAGRIDIAVTRTAATGATNTGLLAAIVFQAVAPGQSQIAVSGMAMSSAGQPLQIQVVPATVVVR
jgi:type II secretory pathway component GspD/PulD (secretin)